VVGGLLGMVDGKKEKKEKRWKDFLKKEKRWKKKRNLES
jgi:hypothetical protein